MEVLNVFQYDNHQDLLAALISRVFKRKNRQVSLQDLAQQLGYKSPRSIGMVLKGQRMPSSHMIQILSKKVQLSEKSRRYFELMVYLHKLKSRNLSQDQKEISDLEREKESLKPKSLTKQEIKNETFNNVSDWYFWVIKQLITCPDFTYDKNWIRKKLKNKVTNLEVINSIETMKYLNLIEEDKEKGHLKVIYNNTKTSNDINNLSIKKHHKQMCQQAGEAVYEEKIENREFFSVTFKFEKEKFQEAKQMIREFALEFEKKFENSSSNSVYQFNIQLFSHLDENLK